MKTQSLSKDFLVSIGVLALVTTMIAAIGAFAAFQHELAGRQVDFLSQYVRERGRNIDRRFSTLSAVQTAAGEELQRRMKAIAPADVNRLMDEYYPLHGDGTRRSRSATFDGETQKAGDVVYGMGAFIGEAAHMTDRQKAAFAAAFRVVSNFGQSSHTQYDNFYFFAPPRLRMVMFGPDRPDHLLFYRKEAPADLDISHEAMSSIVSPELDPAHLTRCTNLQRLVQANHGERLATGCFTPVYWDGRYVGAFGSSLDLTTFFMSAVSNPLPGASNLVATGDGDLIAAPNFGANHNVTDGQLAETTRQLDLKPLLALIGRTRSENGVVASPDGRQIVAYAKLGGPNWYLLMMYPKAAIMWSAMKSASWVLLVGLLAAIGQTAVLVLLARRLVLAPIERLADSCSFERETPQTLHIPQIEARRDEIGVLARALRAEREKADDALNFLEQRVRDRTVELERANAEKSRFLANMSHELRTPLNGVIAIAQALAARQSNDRDRELAELITSSGRLLEQVLGDVLDSSKIEAGDIVLADETFSIEAVVSGVAELHRGAAAAKGLSFSCSVADEAAGLYRGDPVRLTQILSNLLSNAVKFTEAGAVSLSVTRDAALLTLSVTDSGIGFDEAVQGRLFRRFEQADTSIRRRFGGAGLGLSIGRALVDLMGGQIAVRSVPGEGSEFSVTLPLPRAQDQGPLSDDGDDEAGFSLQGCKILLAEDHPTNQKVVQLILEPFGANLQIVENGALALERLNVEAFDIVLMDMQMPELDGLQATRAIRQREAAGALPHMPVIMLTANAMDEHVRDSLDAGADLHLAKPVNPAKLLSAIADLLIAAQGPAEGPRTIRAA